MLTCLILLRAVHGLLRPLLLLHLRLLLLLHLLLLLLQQRTLQYAERLLMRNQSAVTWLPELLRLVVTLPSPRLLLRHPLQQLQMAQVLRLRRKGIAVKRLPPLPVRPLQLWQLQQLQRALVGD